MYVGCCGGWGVAVGRFAERASSFVGKRQFKNFGFGRPVMFSPAPPLMYEEEVRRIHRADLSESDGV